MDDCCAVCADTLEWVAYGACGHKEVCSTCVARLRFICEDRRCCICKTESNVVFVTKALGDYTKMVRDLPSKAREGRCGSYWYHEDTQAFFDDADHYKMIKAVCNLSCSECDKMEEKSTIRFRNIEQLKLHLFHQHRLYMCPLCLEGRKVFVCEQKLYTKAQLKRHTSTGDSVVDGSESERGGFKGHPMCKFCKIGFYGENELYAHMTTGHYKCHLCCDSGEQYEYYKNYHDLELHFSRGHFLCEDESCLEKKFVVFRSEAELKKHSTMEHGGRMSRSKRNAALQLPTSFRYGPSNDQDSRRGRRGLPFRGDSSNDQASSLETPNADDRTLHDPSSSIRQAGSLELLGDTSDIDPIIKPFESLSRPSSDTEASSRYLRVALGKNSGKAKAQLEDSSLFPPLAPGSSSSQLTPKHESDHGLPNNNTMAAHLRRQNNRKMAVECPDIRPAVISSSEAWPAAGRVAPPASSSQMPWPKTNVPGIVSAVTKPAVSSSQAWPAAGRVAPPTNSSQMAWPKANVSAAPPTSSSQKLLSKTNSQNKAWPKVSGCGQNKTAFGKGAGHSSYASTLQAQVENRETSTEVHKCVSLDSSLDFPPVSAAQVVQKLPQQTSEPLLKVGDFQAANKALVENIRAAVDFNEDKYTAFKDISVQYSQGLVDINMYFNFVRQFGLLHLVLDLARLCPNAEKQQELIDAYDNSMRSNGAEEDDGWSQVKVRLKDLKKGKGKSSKNGSTAAPVLDLRSRSD
ncbi:putative transcription factor C2H2 family [Rosa chinensis]|uniref:RING-type E3 ubiquitin transferase n=1 Tax=Rosa chinensis TaxID=74649 RepID=A0A2P6Q4R9_ROSCH|nr:E3 ubiquitin-protein ligase hel2 [Rosa chinensis]PRQ29180.1 putative transcription factor C2H2 family [Rosa chinensis]